MLSVFILAVICGTCLQLLKEPVRPVEARLKTSAPVQIISSTELSRASRRGTASNPESLPLLATEEIPLDICEWIQRPRPASSTLRSVNLEALLPRLSARDQELLSWLFPDYRQNTKPSVKADQAELLFLQALEETGNLLGRSSPMRLDVPKGIELLKKAQDLDPSNGALDLYLASLYQRQSEYELANSYFEKGLRAERFDVYMNSFSKRLLGAPETAVGFMQSVELFSTLPIPDLTPLREALLARTRVGENEDLYRFAQRLADSATQSRTPYNHLDWWLGSYVMARDILRKRGTELIPPFDLHKEFNRFPDIPSGADRESCDSAALERQIAEFQDLIRR